MGRWTDADSDEHRLPEGFARIGYDADSQTYTFRAPDGSIYESLPGNRFGELHRAGQRPQPTPEDVEAQNVAVERGNKESVRMLLPFALLVFALLGLLFRFLNGGEADDSGK